jgi:hypothetical protein
VGEKILDMKGKNKMEDDLLFWKTNVHMNRKSWIELGKISESYAIPKSVILRLALNYLLENPLFLQYEISQWKREHDVTGKLRPLN